jgi:hypothetical protein
MRIRFLTDPDGWPHIAGHGVSEAEAIWVVSNPLERISGRDDSIIVIGRTRSGRILKVIYAPARDGDGIIIITAYDLPAKQIKA